MQDDYVQSYVVKNNMLKPVMDVFIANGNRYNLLNSAVLDLLEHIRKVPFSSFSPFAYICADLILFSDHFIFFCFCREMQRCCSNT